MMPFQRPTLQQIVDRIETDMENRLTGNKPLLRRGILRILARVFAGASHIIYGFIEFVARQLFVITATRDYLNRHGLMWGINRKAASFSRGSIQFTGTNGVTIPSGTRVQNADGVELETTADGIIATGVVNVAGIAVEAGTSGNLAGGTEVKLIEPIIGVNDTAILHTAFGGGEDEESDDAYRARILARIQNPPMGGTKTDYVIWAEAVSGVTKAWCFPVTPGPGHVTVVYTGSALESAVKEYIDTLMPVTANLVVSKAIYVPISFAIKIAPTKASYQSAINANLQSVFSELAKPGSPILISWLRDAIASAGVDDYAITAISGAPQDAYGNLLFSGFDLGQFNSVSYSGF